MDASLSPVPYGTLDLIVIKTLESMGPLHGSSSLDGGRAPNA